MKTVPLPRPPALASPLSPGSGPLEVTLLKVVLIVFAGFLIYMPALHGDWLWDDDNEITANRVLPAPDALSKIWAGEGGADYLPLKSTVQWCLYQVLPFKAPGKIDPTGFHLINISLHVLSALLVWRLMLRLGLRGAWLGGLLFAIHPIMVESVAWVSELKNTLAMPLLLLSMLAYLDYDERGKIGNLVAALVLFLAASLAKASVVMYPVTILLYCWWKRGAISRRDLLNSVPFFLVSAALAWLTMKFQWDRAIANEIIPVGGLVSRTATVGISILFYLGKAVWPFGLNPIYPRWTVDPPTAVQFLPWLVIVGGLALLWIKRRVWGRGILFGLGFFLISLFPIIGFIRMSYMRITWAADHLIYLPMLGLICLVAAAIGEWYHRADLPTRRALLGVGVAVLAVLAIQSNRYAGVFANEYEMWTYTLKGNPDAWQAHSRLGKVLNDLGQYDEAFFHIGESMRLRPDLAETHNNYGAMLERKGDVESGLAQMRLAVKLADDVPMYRSNLGQMLVRHDRKQEACEIFGQLAKMFPGDPGFLCDYGVLLYYLGHNDEAIQAFQQALKIAPDFKNARESLQAALQKKEGGGSPPPAPNGGGLLDSQDKVRLF